MLRNGQIERKYSLFLITCQRRRRNIIVYIQNYTMEIKKSLRYYYTNTKDENPISVLVRKMQVPIGAGISIGLTYQAAKKMLESPATFGRIAYFTFPLCGITFYYLSGSYIMERIRGRDGPFNNLLGAYCTFPVIRKFLPLTHTVAVLFLVSLPWYILARALKIERHELTISEVMGYGVQMSSYDINLLLQKKPSEPFVKRESYDIFTIPSK